MLSALLDQPLLACFYCEEPVLCPYHTQDEGGHAWSRCGIVRLRLETEWDIDFPEICTIKDTIEESLKERTDGLQ